jgi:hypothetical protein
MKYFFQTLSIGMFFLILMPINNSCKKEELPTLSTAFITNIEVTSASSGGNITSDGGDEVTARGVCWSLNVNPSISDTKTNDGTDIGQFVSDISGLTAGSTYHVRAYATNSVGTAYGANLTFSTLGQAPSSVTQPATNISTTAATLNGTVNANYLSTTVTFEYGTTTAYGSSVSATPSPIAGNTSSNVTVNLSGLAEGTAYHFRVKTVNSLGTTDGNDMTFTTLGQVPTATSSGAINIEQTSATLRGIVNANYLFTTVTIEYGETTNYGNSVAALPSTVTGTNSTGVSANVTGLTAVTTYHYRVKAVNKLGTTYSIDNTFTTSSSNTSSGSQIIANHIIVDKFDDIPSYYINEVKKMWLSYAGESHSEAIRNGLLALETAYPTYAVNVVDAGTPEAYTTSNLRASRGTWGDYRNATGWIYSYGEEDWFTTVLAITRTKAGITYCKGHSLTISAFGFGWCWDPGVSASDYLTATQAYIDYCADSILTKVFFTTGPVDLFCAQGEGGYNKSVDYESIRTYVKANSSRILFDYADILCYDAGSETPNTTTWNGHIYPIITSTNLRPEASGHISNTGSLRLAKAMWWMLARIAGWDGS